MIRRRRIVGITGMMSSSKLFSIASEIMLMIIIIAAVLLFLGIGVVVLLHMLVVGRAVRRGLRTMAMAESCSSNTSNGLSPGDLQDLPCFDFNTSNGLSTDCAVCLESFQTGDRCRLLPVCQHSFHANCVDSWLLKTPICPICRANARRDRKNRGGGEAVEDGAGFNPREGREVVIGFSVSPESSPFHTSTSE